MNYCQCKLRKNNVFTTSWLPQKFAVVGETVKLKNNGVWSDGWLVESAGEPLDAALVEPRSRTHLKCRKASDI